MKIIKRCQHLDNNGKQCGETKGVKKHTYFGENEIYFDLTTQWVAVYFCEKHNVERPLHG